MRKLQKVLEKYLWREKVKIESTKASISLHCASNGGTVLCDVFLLCLRWGPSDARLFFTVHMTSFPFSAQGKNHLKYIYIYIYNLAPRCAILGTNGSCFSEILTEGLH
jgi:hypothetical protein